MSNSLHGPWLRGMAFNPAAPSDVLIRLLDRAAGEAGLLLCEGRDLPDAVLDAALRHPDGVIRRTLAHNRYVDPARLAPLATDPSGIVRGWLAAGPRHYPRWVRPLPDDILMSLLTARDGGEDGKLTAKEIVGELDSSRQIPLSFFLRMAGREDPELRVLATWRWESLTPAQRAGLLDDPNAAVREAARERNWSLQPERVEAMLPSFGARNEFVFATCALSPALVEQCFADGSVRPLARNRHTPAYAVARLARHPEAEVRAMVAARPDLGPELVAELREDPDEDVRMRARLHPFPRTWAEYGALQWVIGHGPDCTCPIGEPFTESGVDPAVGPSPDWFAACAVSGDPVFRRVAASWPGLPADLVETLAKDDDEEVRIRLACHHPLAPSHLLLDAFVTRPAHRPHLLARPTFPRTGWAHLVGHPDPEVRAMAAADAAVSDPPVEDPDASVRRAAAANPNLTPDVLEDLLARPGTAEGAAANPALPVARMHALLDDCLNGTAAPAPGQVVDQS
ncbi:MULTISPECIES: hypothetical protein [unclassified Streptomyces]|uniref:hypothetical protein n=1 Tax=unclassified Streptomyces TaxID=2593676 RepID=UPI0006F5FF42|nr:MULTISPECIES: hypothetical protein [unclassified Streptomyces]KQX46124.1 hypothetical protein ASD33_22505 [Streptomyces sp. Root1304]KRA80910.1 hypothetical protein ASE09_15605 [Streptomyces sp. Root66D1]